MSEAIVIDLPNDTIEERILSHVATLDVLTEQARAIIPSALGDDIAEALFDLRAYVEEFAAAELDELRNRAAWFEFAQPKPETLPLPLQPSIPHYVVTSPTPLPQRGPLPPPSPSHIIVRTPSPFPPPKDVLNQ